MRDEPSGVLLLRLAHALLRGPILEDLPEGRRYEARLAANAVAIAARELESGDRPLEVAHAALAVLYGEDGMRAGERPPSETLAESLCRLDWWLAAEIRGGKRDGEARVHEMLRAQALARLREVNPKALPESDP